MEWLPVVGTLAGAALGFAGGIVQSEWDWRRRRRDELDARSANAIISIRDVLIRKSSDFDRSSRWLEPDSGLDARESETYVSDVRMLRSDLLLVRDKNLRSRLSGIIETLWFLTPVAKASEEPVDVVGENLCDHGLALIGCQLRGEPLLQEPPAIRRYREQMEQERLAGYRRYAQAREAKTPQPRKEQPEAPD